MTELASLAIVASFTSGLYTEAGLVAFFLQLGQIADKNFKINFFGQLGKGGRTQANAIAAVIPMIFGSCGPFFHKKDSGISIFLLNSANMRLR